MNKSRKLFIFLLLAFSLFLASCQDKDETDPVLSGYTNITYTIGDALPNLEQGITAVDDVDGDLLSAVEFDSSAVDFTTPGTYTVTISVSDAAGNIASASFTVTVLANPEGPVLAGTQDFELEQGADAPNYLLGVTAIDNFDGDLTDDISVDASAVNYVEVGVYPVIYSVTDSDGNVTTQTRYTTIVLETVSPVISGAVDLVVGLEDTDFDYLADVSALDNFDGDLTNEIAIDSSSINTSVAGTYTLTYSVSDQAGNQTSVTVNVLVKDLVPPVITGQRNLTFEVFSNPNYLWKDIRVTDNLDGDLLSEIVIDSSQVDLTQLGTYPLTYSVTDSSGNTASVTVQITIADRTKPVITASSPIIYYLEGDDVPNYQSLATAFDNYDGDITDQITVNTTAVNLNVVGTYNVIYTVSDNQGNTTSLTIQVIVPSPADVDKVNQDATLLTLPEAPITESYILPLLGSQGSSIKWVSLSPGTVTNLGNIIRPAINQEDAEVELVATIKSGNYQKSFTYFITVAALDEVTVTSMVTLDYTALGTDYITQDGTLNTYFVDGGSVPYVSIEEYLMLIKGALESDILEFAYNGNMMTISYDVEFEDIDGNVVNQTLTAILDFAANTMTVETFDFFSYYIASTTTNYGEGLEYVGADYVDPQPVTFALGEYGFDLVIYNDGVTDVYLMPFHVTNLLFAGNVYFDVYYNGDQYYGLDTRQLYNRNDVNIATIRTSTYNTASMPLDMKLAAYNFLGLSMDYFYGIKKFANVDTYFDLLTPYIDTLVYSGDINFYQGIFKFIYGLDDLHTSHVFTGYYEPTTYSIPLSLQDLGTRSGGYYNRMWGVQDLYDAEFGSYTTVPFSRITPDGKTAIIHIDGFDVETPNAFKRALDELPASVENVVVDIANNGGGNLGAVLRIFGYMTEEDIIYHSQNPADGSAVTYYIQSEYVAYPYNWFVMTSSVSFSAANLMASMAKELGIPVIGQDSSGGASSIGIILPPGGSSLLISTNNVLSARIINELGEYVYLSIEYGITVDHKLSNVADDDEIQALVNLLTSGN